MKNYRSLYVISCIALFIASVTVAQEAGSLVETAPVAAPRSISLLYVVFSGGLWGLLNWAGIFLWAILAVPLGILSIVQCINPCNRQYPLATKLIIIGIVWLFILGWVGVAQGVIFAFSSLSSSGAADPAALALCISQSLYSVATALTVCQLHLFFLLPSIVILHFKHKKMPAGA